MTSHLFAPIEIGGLAFPNRIAVAPMCQYSAQDGSATDWHVQHWMTLAMSGAGMVTIEATAVERRGRITHGDLGLYSDANEAAAKRVLDAAKRVAPAGTQFGVQLAHAGRKASAQRPWEGGKALGTDEDPWITVSPSAVPFDTGWHTPQAMTAEDIERLIARFADAARRAERAGFAFVEIHGAHGYLLHEFLSPFSNRRTDAWGGSLENRMRLILDVAKAVRAAVPQLMVGARLSATEWTEGGFDLDEAVQVAQALKAAGVAYICASSGGNLPKANIPVGPHYQVPLAERIRKETGIVTRAVGMIDDPEAADGLIRNGKADVVALARAMLADPRWPWRAAATLGARLPIIVQYERAAHLVKDFAQVARAVA